MQSPKSPKSPSSSPKKSVRRRANTITFLNNTDDLINEFMNPGSTPITATRRGISPAWQRASDDIDTSSTTMPLRASSLVLPSSDDDSSDGSESIIIAHEASSTSFSGTMIYRKNSGIQKPVKRSVSQKSPSKKKSKPFLEEYKMPHSNDATDVSDYKESLKGFRAFEKFPKGKVLKSKNVNASGKGGAENKKGNTSKPRTMSKPKKQVPVEDFTYEYTVHPLHVSATTHKSNSSRRAEPEKPELVAKGVSLLHTRSRPHYPTTKSTEIASAHSSAHHRRSVIDTCAATLSIQPSTLSSNKKDPETEINMSGEEMVGPLGQLTEKTDLYLKLSREPVFKPDHYSKAMQDPFKTVGREDDHDSDEEEKAPPAPPQSALFDYLTKFKMGGSMRLSVGENSNKMESTFPGKTVRFADTGLPSFDIETPPEYNLPAPSSGFMPLGGGYVPPSLQRPLALETPSTQSVNDNPLGMPKSVNDNPLGMAKSVNDNPLGLPRSEPSPPIPLPSTDANPNTIPVPSTSTIPTPSTGPVPLAMLPPPPPPPPLSQMPLVSSPNPVLGENSEIARLESTLPPGELPPATTTPAFPTFGEPLSTTPAPEEKKDELLLTDAEREERKLIKQILKAKASKNYRTGVYGWKETPANVLFSDVNGNWVLLTDREKAMLSAQEANEASEQLSQDARTALLSTLRNEIMDEENDVDYQCITHNVLDPSLPTYLLQKRYKDRVSTLASEEVALQRPITLQDDYMPPRGKRKSLPNKTRSTMASHAVILRDPVRLLTSEHLDDGVTSLRELSGAARMSMDSLVASALHPIAPPGVKFCELTYAAKVLLSSILYLRALGGFPTLLRVQPLTELSPVIDKENCIELVFWNSEPEPQPDALPEPPSGSIYGRAQSQEVHRPSMAENVLGAALSGVRRRTTTFAGFAAKNNNNDKDQYPSSFRNIPSTDNVAPPPPAQPSHSRPHSPTHRNNSINEKESIRAGIEHGTGPSVPRVRDKEKKKNLRRSSYTSYGALEETVTPETSVKGVFQSVGEVSPWLNYGERSNSLYASAPVMAANAGKKEPPHPADAKGKSRIKGTKEELCIIVRATVAQKSTVYRFGKEETVHVLPPLPSAQEYIDQKVMRETELQRLDVDESNPLSKLVAKDRSVEAKRAAESQKQALQERNKRLAARGAVDVNEKVRSNDYGDLVVGFLLSKEASQLTGVLPDIMELEALRYKIFTLNGYNTEDPNAVVSKPEEEKSPSGAPDPFAQSGMESRMSIFGNAFLDPSKRPSIVDRRSVVGSAGLERGSSFATVSSDNERKPLRRQSTFEQELFNRFGYSSASNDLTTTQQRDKQEYEQMMAKKKLFPLYRASSVSENTIQRYYTVEREKARRRRLAHLQDGACLDDDINSELNTVLDEGVKASYTLSASADTEMQLKNRALHEAEQELLKFRPMNLNGFYSELLEAVQLALDQQVRASKDSVMQAYHM